MIDKKWQMVLLNEWDDFIRLDLHDKEFPKRFMDFVDWWVEELDVIHMREEWLGRIDTKKNHRAVLSLTDIILTAYQECYRRIDELFGAGTVKKYFRKFYDDNPDFLPGEECIKDFIMNIASAISQAYKLE
jgi:hypothetical protein